MHYFVERDTQSYIVQSTEYCSRQVRTYVRRVYIRVVGRRWEGGIGTHTRERKHATLVVPGLNFLISFCYGKNAFRLFVYRFLCGVLSLPPGVFV